VLVSGRVNTAPAWSASPTITTSITTPIDYGGSAASSTKTIASTSGAGTSDAIIFQTASQAERGRITTGGLWRIGGAGTPNSGILLTISNNAASLATSPANALVQIAAADANPTIVTIDSYGTGAATAYSSVSFRRANGTAASPTALQSGDIIAIFGGIGRGATGYSAGNMAQVRFQASENWSDTAQGEQIDFYTTPTTTIATALAARIFASGGIGIGGGGAPTDPSVGGLFLSGQQFVPNITTTSVAQTGTVCWTTGTGKFTVDTTVACLTSLGTAKNVLGDLAPREALRMVDAMRPVAFRYRPGYGDDGRYEQFGLIAEDVALIDERMVGRDVEGALRGVRYMELTAVLAGAIKELKVDNDNLHHDNDNLRVELIQLRKAAN
jgi:hypothetical protein